MPTLSTPTRGSGMGQEAEAETRRRAFTGYEVTERLLQLADRDPLLAMH